MTNAAICPTGTASAPSSAQMLQDFLAGIERVPLIDPDLPDHIKAAQSLRLFDSRHRVRAGLRLLAALPEDLRLDAIEALKQQPTWSYRYFCQLIVAELYLEAGDRRGALPFIRAAATANESDLYAETLLIDAEVAIAAEEGKPHRFAGLREYLGQSFCYRPWQCLDLNAFDLKAARITPCDAWSPVAIGDALLDPVHEIWNARMAQEFRRSMLDGSFRYCSKIRCPFISHRTLPARPADAELDLPAPAGNHQSGPDHHVTGGISTGEAKAPLSASAGRERYGLKTQASPRSVMLGLDRECNLACPQCRPDFHVANESDRTAVDRIIARLTPELWNGVRVVRLNTNGDLFAGRASRRLLEQLSRDRFPQLRFDFITNGQLLDRRTFDHFDLKGRMTGLSISMDAATEETYRIVRRGGEFSRLLSNLEFLDGLRQNEGETFQLRLEFVVSAWNFREMIPFVEIGRRFHADAVLFTAFFNWHFRDEQFRQVNVADPRHPDHQQLVEILRSPEIDVPLVKISGLLHLRDHAPREASEARS